MNRLARCLVALLWLVTGAAALHSLESLPVINPVLLATGGLSALTDDPAASVLNPVAGEGGVSTSTGWIHKLNELSQYDIASVLSFQSNSMFAGWQALNHDDYKRQDIRFGIRCSYAFFRAGVGYKLMFDEIPGYGSARDERLTAGLRLKYRKATLDIGSEHRLPIDDTNRLNCGSFNLCLAQKLEDSFVLAAGLETCKSEGNHYKLGCRYKITPNFSGITSWTSNPGRFGVGTTFNLGTLRISYALQTHPELDWSHTVGITLMFP